MQEMTGAELRDAFNLDNSVTDEEAKKVLSVALERAYQIEGQYDQFKDIENPFNPNKFKKYNLKDNPENQKAYFDEVAGYYGFEEARKIAVFNLHGVKQATKRLSDLTNEMTKITTIGNLAFTDIKSVLSSESLQDELDTLEDEIFSLSETTDPKLKNILKNKERKQKDLSMFKKEFDKIQDMDDSTAIEKRKALKKSFTKYINRLAENNNEIIPADQLDNLFGLLSDYYSLSKDVRKYNNNVTALSDPTNFYAEALRRINARRVRMDKMQEYMQEAVKTFTNVKKSNDLINDIADAGFTIDPKTINEQAIADYDSFVNTLLTDPNIKFIDVNSGNSFGKDDPRFESIKDVIESFNKEATPEKSETDTEVVTEEEVIEDQPAVSDEIQQEDGVPLIQSIKQFNVLPLKLQGLIRSTLSQQNSAREADGESELPLDRFLRTASARKIITKFFKDPENAADVKAFNEKKAPEKSEEAPKAEPVKTTPTPQPTDAVAELAALEQPVIEAEVVTDSLQPILDTISKAKSLAELDTILEEIDLDLLAEDPANIDTVNKAVASRKQELSKSVKYENVKVGDVLVFGDNNFGLVEKVTTTKLTVVPLYGERMTPAKDANKRRTVLKRDFSKVVKSLYDTESNVVIGTKDVPAPTAEEKDLINKNVDLQNDFLTDKKAREIARLKDADRSANDVTDEFSNKLGC